MAEQFTYIIRFEGDGNGGSGIATPLSPEQVGVINKPDPLYPSGPSGGNQGVSIGKTVAAAALISLGSKAIGFVTSNAGQWTGSQGVSERVNASVNIMQMGMAFISNPQTAALAIVLNSAVQVIQSLFDAKWTKIKNDTVQARIGLVQNKSR